MVEAERENLPESSASSTPSTPRYRSLRRFLRDRVTIGALVYFVLITLLAILAKYIAPYAPNVTVGPPLAVPSAHFILGTDELGRDIISRLIYGAQVSLRVGILATAIGIVAGVPIGLFAGFYSGWSDSVLMRLMDGMLAFPSLMLALAVVAVLGPGLWHVTLAIGATSIPVYARLVRASTLHIKETLYVTAARSIGATNARILFRVILPETVSPLTVQATLSFAYAVLTEASLSFLGLGVVPPTPSWGSMLNTGRQFLLQSPLYSVSAGLAVFLTVLSLNLIGDGLRDALDPYQLTRGLH